MDILLDTHFVRAHRRMTNNTHEIRTFTYTRRPTIAPIYRANTAPDEPIPLKFRHNICYSVVRKALKFQFPSANRSGVINEKMGGGQNLPMRRIELNDDNVDLTPF